MKDIKGFENKYAITEDGRVLNLKTNYELKQNINTGGYYSVELSICTGEKRKRFPKSIHRLLAETYIENKLNLPCINHIDGNKQNNTLNNLEWVTYGENLSHAYRIGLRKIGEQKSNSILNGEKVKEIRSKYIFWKYTMNQLAKEFGVSVSTIQSILTKRSWKHIN